MTRYKQDEAIRGKAILRTGPLRTHSQEVDKVGRIILEVASDGVVQVGLECQEAAVFVHGIISRILDNGRNRVRTEREKKVEMREEIEREREKKKRKKEREKEREREREMKDAAEHREPEALEQGFGVRRRN